MQTMTTTTVTSNAQNDSIINSGSQAVMTRQFEVYAMESLLNQCRAGDKKALQTLLNRFERPIKHLAYRLTGNYDDANDVAATATLRICQTITSCKSAVTLPAWVNRIVTNVFYDTCRRSRRCPAISLDALSEQTNEEYQPFVDVQSNAPQAYVDEKERSLILNKAISVLPAFQRQIVVLFYQHEMTYEEISALTGLPVGTVKSRLNRARLALQKSLNSQRTLLLN